MANSGTRKEPDVLVSGRPPRARAKGGRPAAPASRARSRRGLALAGAGTAAAIAVAVVVLATGDDEPQPATRAGASPVASAGSAAPAPTTSATPAPAQVWRDAAVTDLRPLTGLVVNLGRGINDWRAGTISAASTAAALDRFVVSLAEAKTAIDRRAPLASAPRAVVDLRLTADLYLAAVRTARVATDEPRGPLQDQLVLQFQRLRNLGDRAFDQANAELEPLLGKTRQVDGVTIVRTGEVPDWVPLKLAAGPPLTTGAPQPSGTPRTFQDERAEQPLKDWVSTVSDLGLPSGADERKALESGTPTELDALAVALVAGADELYGAADPSGERLVATRVQLALLVHAEAARAAQAARLVSGRSGSAAQLTDVSRLLAGSADLLWDDRLGVRTTGFPAR